MLFGPSSLLNPLLLVIAVVVLLSAARAAWNEARLRSHVLGPPRCLKCDYLVTPETLTRGRCPECGMRYLVGGISTPASRYAVKTARESVPIALLCVGVVLGSVAMNAAPLLWPRLGYNDPRLFFAGFAPPVMIVIPLWYLRRRSIRREIDRLGQAADERGPSATQAS